MHSVMAATDFDGSGGSHVGGVAGVRACLILSKDGLSLGAHPADAEARARQAWEALQRIGDPQRGFVDMGTEIWVVATGGAYAAAMVATPEAQAGRAPRPHGGPAARGRAVAVQRAPRTPVMTDGEGRGASASAHGADVDPSSRRRQPRPQETDGATPPARSAVPGHAQRGRQRGPRRARARVRSH